MYDLRLFLSKQGRIKYVSHLDMFRLMGRAVRRAEIPLWYTEGFNPHPYISFLLALPLGVESLGEPIDMRIVGDITPNEVKDALNKCLPDGIKIESAGTPFNKSSEIAYAEYEVLYSLEDITEGELVSALESGALSCEKSGKSGKKKIIKTVDVSANIKSYSVEKKDDMLLLKVVLPAGSTFNLNPIQLSSALSEYLSKDIVPEKVVRICLLCNDLSKFS